MSERLQFLSVCFCSDGYYTPQVKRRRAQEQVESPSPNSFSDQMDVLRNMLKEINKKIDVVSQREGSFEKKLDIVDKRLGGLIRQANRVSQPMRSELHSRSVLHREVLYDLTDRGESSVKHDRSNDYRE